jgi:sugar/nucleoside kinase (ribokinase family)
MKATSAQSRRGLLAAGNWIIDQVKMIDVYPQPEQLANISSQSQGAGGSAYNVLIDLARLQAPFPLMGAGLVGDDALGRAILEDCKRHGIDARHLRSTPLAPTSYTDVMTEASNGRRTFFHLRGANALWNGANLNFKTIKARILHLGYLLLLDALDAPDPAFGTKAAALLHSAQQAGLKTSVDVVSEDSDRYAAIVGPALKHADYLLINEIEAAKTTGFTIRQTDGRLNPVSLRHAAGALLQRGVRELVAIHFPEGAFIRTRKGEDIWQSSINLPPKHIAGTAGAGDAFAAGLLMGLHENWDLRRCLVTGVSVAAASLSHPTCTGGVKSLAAALKLARKFGHRPALVVTEDLRASGPGAPAKRPQ